MDLESAWEQFMTEDFDTQEMKSYSEQYTINEENHDSVQNGNRQDVPKCSDLKISTRQNYIFEFNFDLYNLFWKIKTIDYDEEKEEVIKNR